MGESLSLENKVKHVITGLVFKEKIIHGDLTRLDELKYFLDEECQDEVLNLSNYIDNIYIIINDSLILYMRLSPSIEKMEETQKILDQSMTKIESINEKAENAETKIENIEVNSISVLEIFSSLIFGLYVISNSSTKILSEFTYDRLGGMIVLFSLSLLLGITLIYFLLYWISLLMNRNISSCKCKDQDTCTCKFFAKHGTYCTILAIFLLSTVIGLCIMYFSSKSEPEDNLENTGVSTINLSQQNKKP